MSKKSFPKQETTVFWEEKLSPEEFQVLRNKGTERPFIGKYNLHSIKGTYYCKGCNAPLYKSTSKFDSGCGWPSFDDAIKDSIEYVLDKSHGMIRTEIVCSNCGSHQGHLFNDGPTESGQRFCVNSLSIGFKEEEE